VHVKKHKWEESTNRSEAAGNISMASETNSSLSLTTGFSKTLFSPDPEEPIRTD